jgi:hypothetical protein
MTTALRPAFTRGNNASRRLAIVVASNWALATETPGASRAIAIMNGAPRSRIMGDVVSSGT